MEYIEDIIISGLVIFAIPFLLKYIIAYKSFHDCIDYISEEKTKLHVRVYYNLRNRWFSYAEHDLTKEEKSSIY